MEPEILVAVVSGICSLISAGGGILISSKLSNYRIEQLEKRVDKHNGLIERMVLVEASAKSAHHRLDEMREELEKA
ncbi:MAG: hypothetical protein RR807_07610 [Oscillospiraceae bacterium]